MSEQLKHHQKYAESVGAYQQTLYRSAFAFRKELEPGLKRLVEESGAPSVSGMLAMLATEPETFTALLKPHFERLQAAKANNPVERRRHKVTIKAVTDQIKSGELTAEEIAAALEAARAKKQAAAQVEESQP